MAAPMVAGAGDRAFEMNNRGKASHEYEYFTNLQSITTRALGDGSSRDVSTVCSRSIGSTICSAGVLVGGGGNSNAFQSRSRQQRGGDRKDPGRTNGTRLLR